MDYSKYACNKKKRCFEYVQNVHILHEDFFFKYKCKKTLRKGRFITIFRSFLH